MLVRCHVHYNRRHLPLMIMLHAEQKHRRFDVRFVLRSGEGWCWEGVHHICDETAPGIDGDHYRIHVIRNLRNVEICCTQPDPAAERSDRSYADAVGAAIGTTPAEALRSARHAYDMIQCALGADTTGPVELWTTSGAGPNAKVRMKYADGFEVSLEADYKSAPFVGAIFTCDKGKIELNEHLFRSNPKNWPRRSRRRRRARSATGRVGWASRTSPTGWSASRAASVPTPTRRSANARRRCATS